MEQFSSNIYLLLHKNNNVVCVYDQHNMLLLLWAYTSNGHCKSIQSYQYYSHLQYVLSYTVVRVVILEYKCMHIVFEYKCMHL